ncbi:Aste57867_14213 [Aphanomyces stellatus]|uniref:Aste57867_14213 protein n=1 Tax=Aphanomyces stellatus TaxID=120398 RepID=A0A485L148_9STRA|nr:hypothetical protein As57867_014162 [Aphanomyces stellatus]VFT91038.1 Aste57867_14213 [Aphanomyces stellatus]
MYGDAEEADPGCNDVTTPRGDDGPASIFTSFHNASNSRSSLTPLTGAASPRWTSTLAMWLLSATLVAGLLVLMAFFGTDAIVTIGSVAVGLCSFEYAWLAARIRHNLLARYNQYQVDIGAKDATHQGPFDATAAAIGPAATRVGLPRAVVAAFFATCVSGVVAGIVLKGQQTLHGAQVTPLVVCTAVSYAVAGFCAALAPSWPSGLILLLQVSGFSLVIFDSFFCGSQSATCYLLINSTFAVAILLVPITIVRIAVARSHDVVDVGVTLCLDLVGVFYVPVLFRTLLSLVGSYSRFDDCLAPRALLVVWGADVGATLATSFGGKVTRFGGLTTMLGDAPRDNSIVALVGAVGGALPSAYVATLLFPSELGIPTWQFLVFGVGAAAASRYGRLFSKMLKRLAGVESTGGVFPGGSGFLDRVDGLLFASVVVAVYHRWAYYGWYVHDSKTYLAMQIEDLTPTDRQWLRTILQQIVSFSVRLPPRPPSSTPSQLPST